MRRTSLNRTIGMHDVWIAIGEAVGWEGASASAASFVAAFGLAIDGRGIGSNDWIVDERGFIRWFATFLAAEEAAMSAAAERIRTGSR